jgi:antitoxin (DNA-binding transcriptional repressor) of toxin-antitoxin stability system
VVTLEAVATPEQDRSFCKQFAEIAINCRASSRFMWMFSTDVQCTSMTRVTVAQARARLADVLDAAERGTPIVIERRGVRFVVRVERRAASSRRRRSAIETLDPAIERGSWTWSFDARGLRFRSRRRP